MLKITGLVKKYGKFMAVDGLELNVPKGEIFGFVGPNGAGKTTTMKIICGLMAADGGNVYVDGIDAIKNSRKAKEVIGYMPDFFGVYDDLKVTEYLDFYASIYNINAKDRKKICDDLLELVDLNDKREAYVDSLSRGMKQRLCLARSLVHNPKILVLDEPASGMDPRARVEMKEILRTLKELGKTILISSHILPELSELCTSIGIIDRGKIVISGTVSDIMQQVYSKRFIKIRLKEKMEEAQRIMLEFPSVISTREGEGFIEAGFEGNDDEMSILLKELVKRDIPIISFAQIDGNLEDVFMRVTKGEGVQMKINPVLQKELKIRMRGWRAAGMIGIYLLFLALTASFVMILSRQEYYRTTINPELAMGGYIGLAITQFVLISFIAPALTTGSISGEREKQTLDLLLCTRMTPFSIIIGKLFASISQIMLLIVASLPIFSTVFLFGGISFKELLELFGFFMIIAITFGSIGIFYSSYFKRTTAANVLAFGTIAFLYFGTIFLTIMYLGIWQNYDYKGVFPLLYSNPIVGFASLLWGQLGGTGSSNFLPGLSLGSQGTGSVSPWVINLIFNITLSASLLLLSANRINPLKSKSRGNVRARRSKKQIG